MDGAIGWGQWGKALKKAPTTLIHWEKAHRDFSLAVKNARELAAAYHEEHNLLKAPQKGEPIVSDARTIFFMKSKFKDQYGDKENINNTNNYYIDTPQKMNLEQWQKHYDKSDK